MSTEVIEESNTTEIQNSENMNPFTFGGFLKRKNFIIYAIVLKIIEKILTNSILSELSAVTQTSGFDNTNRGLLGLLYLGIAAVIWMRLSTIIKRTADTGLNRWFSVLSLIPFVSIIYTVFLAFVPSNKFKK